MENEEKSEIKHGELKRHVNQLNDSQKKNITSRAIMAALMVAVTIPCLVLGGWFWFAFVCLILIILTHELLKAPQKQSRKFKWIIYVFSYIMMITLTFWMFFKTNLMDFYNYYHANGTLNGFNFVLEESFPQPSLSICCFAVNIAFFFLIVLFDKEFTINDCFYFITMFFVCSLGMQCLLYLRYIPFDYLSGHVDGISSNIVINTSDPLFKYLGSALLLGLVILSSTMNDVGAYFVGILFGKHKMTHISPKKTWEGFVGGIVISFICTCAYSFIFEACGLPVLRGVLDSAHWYNILIIALINPLVGTMGDLLFSSIKRNFNIKDFGTILRSHGGVLDRIDSLILVSISTALLILMMINKWNLFI